MQVILVRLFDLGSAIPQRGVEQQQASPNEPLLLYEPATLAALLDTTDEPQQRLAAVAQVDATSSSPHIVSNASFASLADVASSESVTRL